MKKHLIIFLLITAFSLVFAKQTRLAEIVTDPVTGDTHIQCINPGSNCDIGE